VRNKIFNILVFIFLFYPTLAFAGPGGKIAKAIAETFWGKVILIGLTIFFLPLIIYVLLEDACRVFKHLLDSYATQPLTSTFELKT